MTGYDDTGRGTGDKSGGDVASVGSTGANIATIGTGVYGCQGQLMNLFDIDVPMVAAVNVPAITHSAPVLVCEIVLDSQQVRLQDTPNLTEVWRRVMADTWSVL